MKNIKLIKKFHLMSIILIILILIVGCQSNSQKDKDASNNPVKTIDKQNMDTINSTNYVKSSLQSGSYVVMGDKVFTMNSIFKEIKKGEKYSFNLIFNDYLGFNQPYFLVQNIYKYNDELIFIINYSDGSKPYRQIIIQDTKKGERTILKLKNNGSSRQCYILGDRLYFDEYEMNKNDKKVKYLVKYLNLTTLEQRLVCKYEGAFDEAEFVLRKDGAIAFIVNDNNGLSKIQRFNKGIYKDVICKKWCGLVEYDEKGVYFTEPDVTDKKLNSIEYSPDKCNFILCSDSNQQKILLKREGIDADKLRMELKVFDNFFILINKENTYFPNSIEKYDFTGKLLKSIKLKQWPAFGKRVITKSDVIYYEGKILNCYYRGDTGVLEIQTIDIK